MRGGGGGDTFVLRQGRGSVTISDFSRRDRLQLRGNIRVGSLEFSAANGDTIISRGNDELAVLEGVNPGLLSDSLFI